MLGTDFFRTPTCHSFKFLSFHTQDPLHESDTSVGRKTDFMYQNLQEKHNKSLDIQYLDIRYDY